MSQSDLVKEADERRGILIETLRITLRRRIRTVCEQHPDPSIRKTDYTHFSVPKYHTTFGPGYLLHAEQHCLHLLDEERPSHESINVVMYYLLLNGYTAHEDLARVSKQYQDAAQAAYDNSLPGLYEKVRLKPSDLIGKHERLRSDTNRGEGAEADLR